MMDKKAELLNMSDIELLEVLEGADKLDDTNIQRHLSLVRDKQRRKGEEIEIIFLGSEGCRFGMLRGLTGGIWLRSPEADMLIEPGPSALSLIQELGQVNSRFRVEHLDAILCSHFHADHYGNLIPCLEGMTAGLTSSEPKRWLIANTTVIERFKLSNPYHLGFVRTIALAADADRAYDNGARARSVRVKDITIHATPTWRREVENRYRSGIGFFFKIGPIRIWYTSDTAILDDIIASIHNLCAGASLTIIIANAGARHERSSEALSSHLTTRDIIRIVAELEPRYLVLTHYDEPYSGVDYRLAQATYVQRQIQRGGQSTKVFPSAHGLSFVLSDFEGEISSRCYLDRDSVSCFVRDFITWNLSEES